MNIIETVFLIVIVFTLLAVLAYTKRVKLTDKIVVFWESSETWTDPETIPGLVLESDPRVWGDAHLCQSCGESLYVDNTGYFYCQTVNCTEYGDLKNADEIVRLVDLFSVMSRSFVKGSRVNGDVFTKLKDGAEDWISDAIYNAHDGTPPDDTIYQFCEDAADHFAERDEDADMDDFLESIREIEPDIYTSDLTKWLHARNDHTQYLTQATSEFGPIEDGDQLLSLAQMTQRHEIAYSLLDFVENIRKDLINDLEDLADDLSVDVQNAENAAEEE